MAEIDLIKILGEAIAVRRRDQSMTQEHLAGLLGIATDTLSRMEKGKFAPKMSRLPDIADKLNCSVADLFREADIKAADRATTIAEILNPLPEDIQEAMVEMMRQIIKIGEKSDLAPKNWSIH